MTLVRLNSPWLRKKLSNSVFLVSNKTLIKPKRLASSLQVSNAKNHLINKNNSLASSRLHTIAMAEILLLINPIIKPKHSLWQNLPTDLLDCIQDLHHRCSNQIKKKAINFSNSTWEKNRKLLKEICSMIARNSLTTMLQHSILMAKWASSLLQTQIVASVLTSILLSSNRRRNRWLK